MVYKTITQYPQHFQTVITNDNNLLGAKIQKYSDNEINHDKMFVKYYYVHYKQLSRILNNRTQFNPLYLMPVSDVPFRVGLLWNDPQSFTSFSSSITNSRRQP